MIDRTSARVAAYEDPTAEAVCVVCEAPSAPDMPFPVCGTHASALYRRVREIMTAEPLRLALPHVQGTHHGPMRPREPRIEHIYYLRAGDRIKIGRSVNPAARAATLTLSGHVVATEPGDRMTEQNRHSEFAALRLTGEWFRAEAPLTDHIANLNAVPSG